MFTQGFAKTAAPKAAGLGTKIVKGVNKAGKWMKANPGKTLAGAAAASTGANLAQGKSLRQSLTSSVLAPNYKEA